MRNKLFTLLVLLMVGVCGVKGQTEVIIHYDKGTASTNVWTGKAGTDVEGCVLTCLNATKSIAKGTKVDGFNTIKFSNGTQYSLALPASMSISKIKFVAYSNDKTTGSYLFELNGTQYAATDYPFPAGKGSATATYEIEFKSSVSNNMTFTFKGKESAGYIVLTLAPSGPSDDATIKSLTVNDEEVTATENIYSYELPFSYKAETVPVTITPNDAKAIITIGEDGNVTPGARTIDVTIGTADVNFVVTSESGTTTIIYTLKITKSTKASEDTSLKSLLVDQLEPKVDTSDDSKYTLELPYAYEGNLAIVATPNDPNATVRLITSPAMPAAGASVDVQFTVTAENEAISKTYTLTISRKAASTACQLTEFYIDGYKGVIDELNKKIMIKVMQGYSFTKDPIMTVSALAKIPVWDSTTRTVTVTAEDEQTSATYTLETSNIVPLSGSYSVTFGTNYTMPEWMWGAPYKAELKSSANNTTVLGGIEIGAETSQVNMDKGTNVLNMYVSKCSKITLSLGATGTRNMKVYVNSTEKGAKSITANKAPTGYEFAINSNEPVLISVKVPGANGGTRIYGVTIATPLENNGTDQDLVLTGDWDETAYASFNKETVTSMDVTAVAGLSQKPATANPNCLIYTAPSQNITGDNIIVGTEAQSIVLTDDTTKPFNCKKDISAATAKYTRTFAAPGTYSICLPFAAIVPDNVTVLQYVGNNGMTVNFEKVTTIEANIPYLIVVKEANSTIKFTGKVEAEKVLIKLSAPQSIAGSSSEYSFNSNFKPLAAGEATGLYLLNADGSGFVKAGSGATVGSFRAYITTVSETPSNAPRLVIGKDEGGATSMDAEGLNASELTVYSNGGIMEVVAPEAQSVKVYGIDGRLVWVLELNAGSNTVTGLAKGVYVVGNQKVVVK